MDDFAKTKIGFALALLAALFTLSPFLEKVGSRQFLFVGIGISVNSIYYAFLIFLGVAVYFYALNLSTKANKLILTKLGDIAYIVALSIPPLSFSIFLISAIFDFLANFVIRFHFIPFRANLVDLLIIISSSILSSYSLVRGFNDISKKSKQSLVKSYAAQSNRLLEDAKSAFNDKNYPYALLNTLVAWRSSLSKFFSLRSLNPDSNNLRKTLEFAHTRKLIPEKILKRIEATENLIAGAHKDKKSVQSLIHEVESSISDLEIDNLKESESIFSENDYKGSSMSVRISMLLVSFALIYLFLILRSYLLIVR